MKGLRLFLWMTLLTGVVYPLVVWLIASVAWGKQAEGNILEWKGKTVGSLLLAQEFKSDSYFWPRPSAVGYRPLPSGGSNLSWNSEKLRKEVSERAKRYHAAVDKIPSELLYASGSGLDPHVSIPAARFQIDRIAKARHVDSQVVEAIVDKHKIPRQWAIFGEPCVNVLILNTALDQIHDE